jgi:trehalose-6-phosphate synthase
VLVLSCFTGAARELRDALIVNPYDIDQTAAAIRTALEMDPQERKERMQRMRKQVREQNIYRWAGDLIGQLCDFRVTTPKNAAEKSETRASAA